MNQHKVIQGQTEQYLHMFKSLFSIKFVNHKGLYFGIVSYLKT